MHEVAESAKNIKLGAFESKFDILYRISSYRAAKRQFGIKITQILVELFIRFLFFLFTTSQFV